MESEKHSIGPVMVVLCESLHHSERCLGDLQGGDRSTTVVRNKKSRATAQLRKWKRRRDFKKHG